MGQFGNALGVVDDYLRHCRRVGDVEECAIEFNDICKATNNMDYTYQIDNKLKELSWERNEKREQLGRSDMDEMYVLQKNDELYNLLLSDVNSLSISYMGKQIKNDY